MRICFFTDVHIHDEYTSLQAIALLKKAVAEHKPDLMLGLGDIYDNRGRLLEHGPKLKAALDQFAVPYHIVYGNHDGSHDSSGGEGLGWLDFQNIFGPAQTDFEFMGYHFVLLADMEKSSNWLEFAKEKIKKNSIVCCHGSRFRSELDIFSKCGARLVFNGHMHMSNKMLSSDGGCEQVTISSFRFGGMDGTAAGCAIVDFEAEAYQLQWVLSELPNMHTGQIVERRKSNGLDWYKHDDDAFFLQQQVLNFKDLQYKGSYFNIECWQNGQLLWSKKNGGPDYHDLCPLSAVFWQGRHYLFCAGTWVKRDGVYKSLRVLDALDGQFLYDVETVGINVVPSVEKGIAYLLSQDRVVTALDLASGKMLWSKLCEADQKDLLWRDNRFGGGWSVTPIAVGLENIWVADFRGNLLGLNKASGEIVKQYLAILPCLDYGVYAYTMGFAKREVKCIQKDGGALQFDFGGVVIDDVSGMIV